MYLHRELDVLKDSKYNVSLDDIRFTKNKSDEILELQQVLSFIGYDVGEIDGYVGNRTKTAFLDFKNDHFHINDIMLDDLVIEEFNKKLDYINGLYELPFMIKKEYDNNDFVEAVDYLSTGFGLTSNCQKAYICATAFWETNRTLKPVVEAYWKSETWRRDNLQYFPYHRSWLCSINMEE